MKITVFENSGSWRYLWFKHINGVDLSQHCARCLKGEYNNAISPRVKELHDLPLESGIWYLCGVALPYVWANNFHLAFHDCPGSHVSVDRLGIHVEIEDAEALPISEEFLHQDDPHIRLKAYRTCRNWQFANWLSDRL